MRLNNHKFCVLFVRNKAFSVFIALLKSARGGGVSKLFFFSLAEAEISQLWLRFYLVVNKTEQEATG